MNLAFAWLGLGSISWASSALPTEMIGCQHLLNGTRIEVMLRVDHSFAVRAPGSEAPVSLATFELGYALENLGFQATPELRQFGGQSVLLVGEGFGALLSEFKDAGVNVKAVDPLYMFRGEIGVERRSLSSSQLMMLNHADRFLREHRRDLVEGTAENLPFPDASFDCYISHLLYSPTRAPRGIGLGLASTLQGFDEALRVLKPGGSALNVIEIDRDEPPDRSPLYVRLRELQSGGQIAKFTLTPLEARAPLYRMENGDVTSLPSHELSLARVVILKPTEGPSESAEKL